MTFINWKEIPGVPGSKPRKVPWSAAKNEAIDPHDPANHLTEDQARSTGLPVGFVLTDNDPYFLFDIDDCLLPDGNWHPHALQICAMFPGGAMEISHSGNGLHVMGCCNGSVLADRRNKFRFGDVACEFYFTKRFVALGRGLQGDMALDWTGVLQQLVPTADPVSAPLMTSGPVAEYTGPADDEELIRMMLAARGSAAQMFGDKASVADLWNRNVPVLAKVFPSPSGAEYDGSSADAALMSHLAFYTGKDAPRMDRLFRRSGLMREKYERREDYQSATIGGAISKCTKVYDKPRSTPAADNRVINPELLSIDEQITHFDGCVYVSSEHKIMVPGGVLMKPAEFKAVYGGHEFLMSRDGRKPTMNAFEAFTENRMYRFPKVRRTRFLPAMPHGQICDYYSNPVTLIPGLDTIEDGVNVYDPPIITTVEGDVAPFLDLLAKLLPVEHDRQILLSWCAALVQNPGKKFLWSPVLQGTKGNGKSVLGEILIYCVGERYAWTPKASKIDARFNAFLRNRIFVNVEEMHMFHKYEILETLKDYITGSRQEIERKGVDAEMDSDYCANWLFCTNHKDAVIKERDDRRLAVFFTAQQTRTDMIRDGMLTDGYFPKFWDWLRRYGFARIRHFLLNYDIPEEFNPAGACFMAPETSSTSEAIEASYGVAEQHILEAVADDVQGFRGGWISTYAVAELLRENGIKRSPRKIGFMLEALGYENRGRSTMPIMQEHLKRPYLWALPGTETDYLVAQQYVKG